MTLTTGRAVHVECRGITKRFGATLALDKVDVRIARGTVHGLVGENGAGKSTLGKLLAGVHRADSGTVHIDGKVAQFASPREALNARVTIMAQELSLVKDRTVVENVFLGIEDHTGPWVRTKLVRQRFADLVERTGITVDPDIRVGLLSIGDQQKVEILRSLAREAQLIMMDEPTARLSGSEIETLHQTVRSLARAGTTVVYISHYLDEVLDLADVVTVMRDGRVVITTPAHEQTHRSLIEGMTGQAMERAFPAVQRASGDAPVVLRTSGLSRNGVFDDINLTVRAGEIVALAGLVGSGRTEVVRVIAGADRPDGGRMMLDGELHRPRSPAQGIAAGVVMIPESRASQGLLLSRSVRENITLPYLTDLRSWGFIRQREEMRTAQDRAERVGVRTDGVHAPVSSLSGGNQQKVLFARALVRTPRLLIADEPTRGVDVGAKRAIYDVITDLAAQGLAVLIVSSEMEEVLGLAHRIHVLHEGRMVAEFNGETASEHDVMSAAFDAPADDVLGLNNRR